MAQTVSWSLVKRDLVKSESLQHTDRELLQNSSFEIARNELENARKDHDENSKTLRTLNKMRPVLDVLGAFGDVVEPFSKLDPHGIASVVVGSFRVFVKFANGYADEFEAVANALEQIHWKLGLLVTGSNREKFQNNRSPRLDVALYNVFRAYWSFFDEAYSLYRKKDSRRHVHLHFKDFLIRKNEKVKHGAGEVGNLCERALQELALENDIRNDQRIDEVSAKLDEMQRGMKEAEWETVCRGFKEMLKPVTEVDRYLKDTLSKRAPDTGDWIFSDPVISSWMRSGELEQPILWMSAAPGFGKSSLTAFITQEIRRSHPTGVAYFSCSHQRKGRQTAQSILSTLIHQLLRTDRYTGKPHFEIDSACVEAYQDSLPLDVDLLCDIFRSLARNQNKPAVLIVDALDECPRDSGEAEAEFQMMFDTLFNLASNTWRILLVSRPSPWFRQAMRDTLQSRMTSRLITHNDNKADIDAFVVYKLDELSSSKTYKWDEALKGDASRLLINESKGLFKLTDLLLQKLSASVADPEKARKILKDPPLDLDETYNRTLHRLADLTDEEEELRSRLSRVLRWVLRAYRPLHLEELKAGLFYRPHNPEADFDKHTDAIRLEIEDYLGDILTVNEASQEVTLTHETAREFLWSSPKSKHYKDRYQPIPSNRAEIDREILQVCLAYLCEPDRGFLVAFMSGPFAHQRFRGMLNAWPLWEYAAVGLIFHLIEVCNAKLLDTTTKEDLDTFLNAEKNEYLLRWLQIFTYMRHENFAGTTEAYTLMQRALNSSKGPRVRELANILEQDFRNVKKHLGYAAGGRFIRWHRFLEHHAPPCYSPVALASVFDFPEALDKYLEAGEPADTPGRARKNAVFWAAFGDSPNALDVLFGPKYNHLFPDRHDPLPDRHGAVTPLFDAIFLPRGIMRRPGTFPAAIRLMQDGARLGPALEEVMLDSTEDSAGAAELAEKMLVRHRGALSFISDVVGPIINYTGWVGHSLMLSALLKHQKEGISEQHLSPRMRFGRAGVMMGPLDYAARNNDAVSARALFDNGVDRTAAVVRKNELNQWTPLHFAAQQGLEKVKRYRELGKAEWYAVRHDIDFTGHVIHVLLERRADPKIEDDSKNLAIHLAAQLGHHLVVDALSKLSYAWDVPNQAGKTPLTIAIEVGNNPAIKALLDNGADPMQVPSNTANLENTFHLHPRLHATKHASIPQDTPPGTFHLVKAMRSFVPTKFLPIPLIARILELAEYRDIATITRRDPGICVTGQLTGDMPFLLSPPITSSNSLPVRDLALSARTKRQQLAGHDMEKTWCWMRTDKVDGAGHTATWHPDPIWRWNYKPWRDETVKYSWRRDRDRRYLALLREGNRVVITPVAMFPAWFAFVEWATIRMDVAVLRERVGSKERERLWPVPRHAAGPKVVETLRRYRKGEWACPFYVPV